MQKSQKTHQKTRSRYSKFKEWCSYHNIPTFAFPIIVCVILAIAIAIIGGYALGYNVGKYLTSSTAVLIYSLVGSFIVLAIAYKVVFKRDRW